MLVDHGIEPEAATLAFILNEGSSASELREKSNGTGRGANHVSVAHIEARHMATFQSRMKIEVVGDAADVVSCNTCSSSSRGSPAVLETALRVAPDSSTM